MAGETVLVIDDEPQIHRFLRPALASQGYRVLAAQNGQEGLLQASSHRPDLVLLDLGLPDITGLTVLARLREWSTAPVIILSARGEEDAKVRALDSGADDYLAKPFGVTELLARMRVALRHAAQAEQREPLREFEQGGLRVDLVRRQVFRCAEEVHLTPLEYRLLLELVKHSGKVLTHKHLLNAVWGPGYLTQSHYLRIYMRQLRHKLEDDPAQPKLLINEPGVGYRLRMDSPASTPTTAS
jgi:two-component system KDP operon response regulator KdpE